MSRSARIAQGITLIITWLTKLLGLAGGANQLILHGSAPNSVALFLSGFLLAGAQGFETWALRFIEVMMDKGTGRPHQLPPAEPPASREEET